MDKTLHLISFYEITIYGEPQEHFWVNFMDHLDSLHQWGMNLVLNPLEFGHFLQIAYFGLISKYVHQYQNYSVLVLV